MLFSIVTPTILRPSLAETCRSVDQQSFADFEHVVVIDGAYGCFPPGISDSKRIFSWCGVRHGNWGNTCRGRGQDLAVGDYYIFVDDDNTLAPNALEIIAEVIEPHPPAWVLFPAQVYGERWLNQPPGSSRTVSCQFAMRRDLGIRWPDNANYAADGELCDQLLKLSPPLVIDIVECLAFVDKARYGAMS